MMGKINPFITHLCQPSNYPYSVWIYCLLLLLVQVLFCSDSGFKIVWSETDVTSVTSLLEDARYIKMRQQPNNKKRHRTRDDHGSSEYSDQYFI